MEEVNINSLFNLLDTWRHLPAYQLERRADIFFALHLKEILKNTHNIDIEYIIPEFPIQKAIISDLAKKEGKDEIKSTNQSFKIDYLCVSKEDTYLIELKTDNNSRNNNQDSYLELTSKLTIKEIVEGVKNIAKASKETEKYKFLCKEIEKAKLNSTTLSSKEPKVIYIQPNINEKENIKNKIFITFQDIIDNVNTDKNLLTIRFIESLKKWK